LTGIVRRELSSRVDLWSRQKGKLDGTGAVWGADVVYVSRFLNVELENRFREEVVTKERSFLEERQAGIISQTRRGGLRKMNAQNE